MKKGKLDLTIERLRDVLEACQKNGIYFDASLFDLEPETSLKLLDDRTILYAFIEEIISDPRFRPDHPLKLKAIQLRETVDAGWPKEE